MSLTVGITIKNLPEIKRAFAMAPHIVGPRMDIAIRRAIFTIGAKSRRFTPVDTGRLRASHQEIFRPMYGEIGTHVNYDIFVHEGTRYMRARPFLRTAVEDSEQDVEKYFANSLQEALNTIARMT